MKYLKAINKLSNSDRNRGIGHVNIGVQNLNNYRKSDGSFSFWGETADSSVWLTAYVAKLLSYAVGYGNINAKYITDALSYVSQKQKPDGNFVAPANFYYDVKSSSQTGHSLTAFCAIAFMESKEFVSYERFKPVVDKAINFISKSTATLTDNLEIAISAYALALAKNDTTGFLDELKKNAFQSDGKMYWYRDSQSLSGSVSQAVNVEIAAYAIMAFVEHGKPIEAVPIMNWLMTQRNEKGGFYSTTDTVIGLQALAKIAAALHVPSVSMEVKLTYGNDQQKIFNINQNTAMILQTQMLEKNARSVGFNANGTGYATVQVSYRYNVVLGTPNERFSLTAVPTLTGSNLKLQICASFVPHESITNSAMTLVEAVLPSGYVYNPQTFEMVKNVGVRVRIFHNIQK